MKLSIKNTLLILIVPVIGLGQSSYHEELKIYNSLVDSLYDLSTCLQIVYPPYYKCCNQDALYGDDFAKCCEKSSIPKEFRVYCSRCVNKGDFDTLEVLMVTDEFLVKLDIREEKKYVLSRLKNYDDLNSFVTSFSQSSDKIRAACRNPVPLGGVFLCNILQGRPIGRPYIR